jgi:transposase
VQDAAKRIEELQKALAERDAEIAKRDVEIARLVAEVARLTEWVAVLQRRLGQDSSNSSKPPSSDPPASRNRRKQARRDRKNRRKRGGQKGHKGHQRQVLPESEVDELVHLYPDQCENCWQPLPQVPDPGAKRHQVTELPPIRPHTTEYCWHQVRCPCCGYRTQAKRHGRAAKTTFGPRLMAVMALLTGVYHLSRRKTVELLSAPGRGLVVREGDRGGGFWSR